MKMAVLLVSLMKDLKFHFIGIGGVGMSGIALLVSGLGASVSGSDLEESVSVKMLKKAGRKCKCRTAFC